MSLRLDPESFEIDALLDIVDMTGKRVLEIGCGWGRLTWRYADQAAYVIGLDPDPEVAAVAQANIPARLATRVEIHNTRVEEYAKIHPQPDFDVVILSWALC